VTQTPAAAPPVPAPASRAGPAASFLRRHRGLLIAAAIGVLVLAILAGRWWLGLAVQTEAVLRRDLVQTVVASGHVEAAHRLDVGAQITGTVVRVPVTEGQTVKAGDLLVELDATELTATGRQADAAVAQAQARLRQLQEVQAPVAAQTLRQANASLENARSALARNEALFRQGFISQAALDDTRKAGELADAQMQTTRRQLDSTGATGSDRAIAVADVAVARATAQAAEARTAYAAIHAPVGGTLIARNVEVGDVVQPGRSLMTLSPRGPTQLVVQIDERNLALLALGQSALASADAYATQRFAAVLGYINPGVDAATGAVEIKLDVSRPPSVLKQDMTVSVDIEVARRPQVLVVPTAAVREADGVAPWVLRVEGRHAVRRDVRLGLRSGGLAEVVEGLGEHDVVVTSPTTVAPGARVRGTAGPSSAASAASASTASTASPAASASSASSASSAAR
jgi:HlyD family secretion protein